MAAALALIGGALWLAWRHHDDTHVRTAEAKAALRELPYRLRYRRVPIPDGLSAVIAGQAQARDGTTINFAILLGGAGERTARVPIVPGAGHQTSTRVANATVITSGLSGTPGGPSQAEITMGLAIENAIFARAPRVPHEA